MKARRTVGWRELTAVLLGGMIGTAARLGIDLLLPPSETDFPVGTLIVNVLGSLLLGLAVGGLTTRTPLWVRAGLGAGVLGSFTTFSALVVSVGVLTTSSVALAVGYLVASIVLGFAAAAVGLLLGRRTQEART